MASVCREGRTNEYINAVGHGLVAPVVGEVHIRAREARCVRGIFFCRKSTQTLLQHNPLRVNGSHWVRRQRTSYTYTRRG